MAAVRNEYTHLLSVISIVIYCITSNFLLRTWSSVSRFWSISLIPSLGMDFNDVDSRPKLTRTARGHLSSHSLLLTPGQPSALLITSWPLLLLHYFHFLCFQASFLQLLFNVTLIPVPCTSPIHLSAAPWTISLLSLTWASRSILELRSHQHGDSFATAVLLWANTDLG